jgi:TPR repeat protein
MALHDALRMLVSEYGSGILRDPCLVSLLGDRGAFEKLPCLRDVMEALASQGILSSLSSAEPSQYPAIVSRAAEGPDLKQGFERSSVLYALESVSFALGSRDSAPAVPDHLEQGGAGSRDGTEKTDSQSERDSRAAALWYRKAAANGDVPAMTSIGILYIAGKGVPRDYVAARKWFLKAAAEGYQEAQYRLGWLYETGLGGGVDNSEALRWYLAAAGQGHVRAQCSLGHMYFLGHGAEQDFAESFRWYKAAADQGDAEAEAALGEMCDFGEGVRQDYQEAAKWYRKAAEQGVPNAMAGLARLLLNGFGAAQDYAEAVKWYRMAAELGNLEAITELQNLGEDS